LDCSSMVGSDRNLAQEAGTRYVTILQPKHFADVFSIKKISAFPQRTKISKIFAPD